MAVNKIKENVFRRVFTVQEDYLDEVNWEKDNPQANVKKIDVMKGKNKVVVNPPTGTIVSHNELEGEVISEVEELELTEDVLNEGVEFAVDYFAKSGINEDGLDLIIEEVGLDDFVEFVLDPSEDLMEERKARRANVKAKSYAQVKSEVDKSDAAKKAAGKGEYSKAYAKKETDVTVYDDKKKVSSKKSAKTPAQQLAKRRADDDLAGAPLQKKPTVKKVTVKKAAPAKKAETKKKVVASVEKVKKKQPLKPISRPGLGSKIRSAVAKGVERHKAATKKASGELKKISKTAVATAKQHSQHRKDLVSGLKATKKEKKIAGGIGKAVKKAVVGEDTEYGYDKDGKSLNPDDKPIKDQTDKQIADVTFDGGGPDGGATIKGSGDPREIPTAINLIKNKYRARGILVAHKESDWRKELSEKKTDTLATEAKVDTGTPEEKEKARNIRKFGVSHNVAGHGKLRRALHRSDRGYKKIKGDKPQLEQEGVVNEAQTAYEKARKAAARRAADRNAARKRGERGGRMERETYTNETGTRMHYKGYRANANEEVVTELNRYGKETGKATGSINKRAGTPVKKGGNTSDKALTFVRNMIRKETGKPEGQQKKVKGEKGRVQYGDRKFSPADSIAKRRASKAAADAAMRDTSGT